MLQTCFLSKLLAVIASTWALKDASTFHRNPWWSPTERQKTVAGDKCCLFRNGVVYRAGPGSFLFLILIFVEKRRNNMIQFVITRSRYWGARRALCKELKYQHVSVANWKKFNLKYATNSEVWSGKQRVDRASAARTRPQWHKAESSRGHATIEEFFFFFFFLVPNTGCRQKVLKWSILFKVQQEVGFVWELRKWLVGVTGSLEFSGWTCQVRSGGEGWRPGWVTQFIGKSCQEWKKEKSTSCYLQMSDTYHVLHRRLIDWCKEYISIGLGRQEWDQKLKIGTEICSDWNIIVVLLCQQLKKEAVSGHLTRKDTK